MFQKELYNGIPNATMWRILRKRLEQDVQGFLITRHTITFEIP
jgi:hypothetical protein